MMLSLSRRGLAFLGFGVLLAVGLYWAFGTSDERKVLAVVRELGAAVSSQPGDTVASRDRRILATFGKRMTDSVELRLPELGDLEGRDGIADLLSSGGVPLELSIAEPEVRFSAQNQRARVTLVATLTLRLPGEERHDTRPVTLELVRAGGEWRVCRIDVDAQPRKWPEARP